MNNTRKIYKKQCISTFKFLMHLNLSFLDKVEFLEFVIQHVLKMGITTVLNMGMGHMSQTLGILGFQ